MGQITIAATAAFNGTSLSTSVVFDAESVHQGVMTADTTYEMLSEMLNSGLGAPQAVAVYNAGLVDVSVRLLYSSTKYYFLCVPPGCVILVPTLVRDGSLIVDWQQLHVRTVSGTANVEYVLIH